VTAIVGTEGGRWLRAIVYMIAIVTGAWAVAWPSVVVLDTASRLVAASYGIALIIGGMVCLWGTWRGRWDGELIGLPITMTATIAYAIILCITITSSLGRGTAVGVALLATGLLADRWRGVRIVARLAREAAAHGPTRAA